MSEEEVKDAVEQRAAERAEVPAQDAPAEGAAPAVAPAEGDSTPPEVASEQAAG